MSMAKTAYKGYQLAKTAIGLINAEHKYLDSPIGPANASSTGSITNLVGIGQGDDYYQRNGNSIKIKDLFLRMWFTYGNVNNLIRVLLVRQNFTNGAAVTLAQILEQPTNVLSSYNKETMGEQITVLMDKQFTLDATKQTHSFKKKIVLGTHVKYQSAGAATADIASGGLWLIVFGSNAGATPGSYNAFIRANFLDN